MYRTQNGRNRVCSKDAISSKDAIWWRPSHAEAIATRNKKLLLALGIAWWDSRKQGLLLLILQLNIALHCTSQELKKKRCLDCEF